METAIKKVTIITLILKCYKAYFDLQHKVDHLFFLLQFAQFEMNDLVHSVNMVKVSN